MNKTRKYAKQKHNPKYMRIDNKVYQNEETWCFFDIVHPQDKPPHTAKPAKKLIRPTNTPTYAAVCTPMRGKTAGECNIASEACSRHTNTKLTTNSRWELVCGSPRTSSDSGSDSGERRYAEDKRRLSPTDKMMELKRWRHAMKTGIFYQPTNVREHPKPKCGCTHNDR